MKIKTAVASEPPLLAAGHAGAASVQTSAAVPSPDTRGGKTARLQDDLWPQRFSFPILSAQYSCSERLIITQFGSHQLFSLLWELFLSLLTRTSCMSIRAREKLRVKNAN